MAAVIPRSMINPEITSIIRTNLFLQPKVGGKFADLAPKEPIMFYRLEEDRVHLPKAFASILFPKLPLREYEESRINFTGSLLPRQEEITGEAMEHMTKYGSTTLGLYPGFGKTVTGAWLSAGLNRITCIIYPRETLGDQWRSTYERFTDAKICLIGEDEVLPEHNVYLCLDKRVAKIPDIDRVGLLILDEAHMLCTPSHVNDFLSFHPQYIINCTATLERSDGMHVMVQAMSGLHGIFRKAKLEYDVVRINTRITATRETNKRGDVSWTTLIKSLLMNEERNGYIVQIVQGYPEKKIMILTHLVEHTRLLVQLLEQVGIKAEFMAGTKRRFQDSNVLVGTIPKVGTGLDIATAAVDYDGRPIDLLMMVTSFKQPGLFEQTIGRAFRSKRPLIYHFVDDDSIIKRHWSVAKKFYLESGATITEHTVS